MPLSAARGLIVVLGLGIVSLSMSGCSWIFTQPLRDDRLPSDVPVCSSSSWPPMVDTLLFVTNAGTTAYVATQDVNDKALRVSAGIGLTTLWLLSATYGYLKINGCLEAIRNHDTGFQRPIGTGGEVFAPPPPAQP